MSTLKAKIDLKRQSILEKAQERAVSGDTSFTVRELMSLKENFDTRASVLEVSDADKKILNAVVRFEQVAGRPVNHRQREEQGLAVHLMVAPPVSNFYN